MLKEYWPDEVNEALGFSNGDLVRSVYKHEKEIGIIVKIKTRKSEPFGAASSFSNLFYILWPNKKITKSFCDELVPVNPKSE